VGYKLVLHVLPRQNNFAMKLQLTQHYLDWINGLKDRADPGQGNQNQDIELALQLIRNLPDTDYG
jgi:hypothetical protein